VNVDDELRVLRSRVDAVVVEVISGGAGQYCSVRLVTPGGPEVAGGTPTFADGPTTVAIGLVSGAPSPGSRYPGAKVDSRWVFG
jgi:hypothetical protein